MFMKLLTALFASFACFTQALYGEFAERETSNALFVCENSLEMLEWDLKLIEQAESSLEISLSYCGGKTLKRVLDAVENRMRACPQLKVHLLAIPTFFSPEEKNRFQCLQNHFKDRLKYQLTTTVICNYPDLTAIDNHIKMMVVDEYYFSLGGTNLEDVLCSDGSFTPPRDVQREQSGVICLPGNGPAGSRDQDVVGRGPLAKELRLLFFKLYAQWELYLVQNGPFIKDLDHFANKTAYFPPSTIVNKLEAFENHKDLIEAQDAKILVSGPMHQPNKITAEYQRLIEEAKSEVVIGNLYFAPAKPLLQTCLKAVQRGVRLDLITNGVGEKAPEYTKFFAWAHRIHYVPLLYGKSFHCYEYWTANNSPLTRARIYEYDVLDVLYHKKVMVVDGTQSVVGSYNLGYRSDSGDYEIVLVINSPKIAEKFLNVLNRDKSLSRLISHHEALTWYFDPVISYIGTLQTKFQQIF